MHITSCRFYKLGWICSPCKDFSNGGDCPHIFLSFRWPTRSFLNPFRRGHLQRVYFLFLPNSSHIISKYSHGSKNLHTATWTRFLGTGRRCLTKAYTPRTHSRVKTGSIHTPPERSHEATLFLKYWHLNVFFFFFFAWRLPKPAVWDESLIIHHRLQTQVVQVLGMQPEPAQVHVHPDGCSGSVPRGFSGAARGPPLQPCWHLPVEPRPNGFLLWFCSLGMRTDGRTDGRSWRVAATMPYSQRSQCFSTRMVQPQPSAAFQKSLLQHRKRRPHDQAN